MRGDESCIVRIAELHQQLQDCNLQMADMDTAVGIIRINKQLLNNERTSIWLVSAIQNRQQLFRAKIARLLYSIEHEEAYSHTRSQADGDDAVPDGVIIIR